jgi:hypothetical protein
LGREAEKPPFIPLATMSM